jgi:hypothetical protein
MCEPAAHYHRESMFDTIENLILDLLERIVPDSRPDADTRRRADIVSAFARIGGRQQLRLTSGAHTHVLLPNRRTCA